MSLSVLRLLTRRLIIAQVLDAITLAYFWLIIGPGQQTEQNPIIVAILALGGIQLFLLIKVGIALLVAYRTEHPSRPITSSLYRRTQLLLLTIATASGIVGAGFNLGAIIYSQTGFLVHF